MGIYLVPAIMKPYSKISSWLIQLGFREEDKMEYIMTPTEIKVVLKQHTIYYPSYSIMTMKTDLEGRASQYKLHVESSVNRIVPLEILLEIATGNKEFGTFKGSFNLFDKTGKDLVAKVYDMLDPDLREAISTPLQWLVYIPNQQVLTRLVYVVKVSGNITVRPFGVNNILLEIEKATLDKVEPWSTKHMKVSCIKKQVLNDYWRSLLAEEKMQELSNFFEVEEEEEGEKERESVEVGEVE